MLTAWVLARIAAPVGYGVCFLLAALFMGLSYVALAQVREPRAASGGRRTRRSAPICGGPAGSCATTTT